MTTPRILPGFDRLIAVLERFNMASSLPPPSPKAPKPGARVLGVPFDRHLAELYTHMNGALIGDLNLYGFDGGSRWDLIDFNKDIRMAREGLPALTNDVIYFGNIVRTAYRFAVVPSLINVEGVQPVLHLDEHEKFYIHPLASSVDRFFDLWARHSESKLETFGRLDPWMEDENDDAAAYTHITDEIRLIAEDKELVRMMKAGNFDRFIGEERESREWVDSVIRAAGK